MGIRLEIVGVGGHCMCMGGMGRRLDHAGRRGSGRSIVCWERRLGSIVRRCIVRRITVVEGWGGFVRGFRGMHCIQSARKQGRCCQRLQLRKGYNFISIGVK